MIFKLILFSSIVFLNFSNLYSQQKNNWNYEPDNPNKVEDKGFYAISTKKFSVTHPSKDRELIIDVGDAFPFLGFVGEVALLKFEETKIRAPRKNFTYNLQSNYLIQKYHEAIDKSYRFLSSAERHKMLVFLREKNIINSIRDAEKTWSDDKILDAYIKLKSNNENLIVK